MVTARPIQCCLSSSRRWRSPAANGRSGRAGRGCDDWRSHGADIRRADHGRSFKPYVAGRGEAGIFRAGFVFRRFHMRVILSTVAAASPRPLCRTMAVVGLLAASAMATPARADLLGKQLFPSDHAWRQDISNAPVAANSAAIMAKIGTVTRITPYWYRDNPADGTFPLYGIPYNVVHGNSTAKVSVVVDNFPSESDLVPVPIPPNAVLEGDYENGPNPNGAGYGENGNPNQRGDSHLIVFDVDNNVAYELYGVSRPGDSTLFPDNADVEQPHTDGLWHAAQETVW